MQACNNVIKPGLTGASANVQVIEIIGYLLLIFIQTLLYSFETKKFKSSNNEAPMKKTFFAIKTITKAVLSFMFTIGTNLLANICLLA